MPPPTNTTYSTQRLLGIYVYYRLCLGLILGLTHWSGFSQNIFGSARPQVFDNITLFYIVVCTFSLLIYWAKIIQSNSKHMLGLLIFDTVALVLMIYASGNLVSGMGYLLLIPMAVGSTFLKNQANIGLAAFGTILILISSLFNARDGLGDSRSIFSAGTTGVLLFVTAISFRFFTQKLQQSESVAKKQSEHADYLQSISQKIVETMKTGVVVVDHNIRIQLINHAAAVMLTINNKFQNIEDITELHNRLQLWHNDGVIPPAFPVRLSDEKTLRVSFSALPTSRFASVMLLIEDMQHISQEAQQLKLASLGRLTASIAHEIRNPLGAISHASQLLNESEKIDDGDQQLLDIIQNHSQRINDIIVSILTFSRRRHTKTETIEITHWLENFRDEYLLDHQGEILLECEKSPIQCHIDPTHLYQIIGNLVSNGMRYNEEQTGQRQVIIKVNEHVDKRAMLAIIDHGPGISQDKLQNLFEPFYTTEAKGSGLGLFICKELCEANKADINYLYDNENKQSVFKLLLN